MKIIGTAACPACAIAGHDGDSCRANLLDNQHVACYSCGSITAVPSQKDRQVFAAKPAAIKSIIANLIRSREADAPGLKLSCERDGIGEVSADRAAAAVAQGSVDALFEADSIVTMVFASEDPTARLELRYNKNAIDSVSATAFGILLKGGYPLSQEAEKVAPSTQFDQHLRSRRCPPDLAAACGRLLLSGFTIKHSNLNDRLCRVLLSFVDPASGGKSVEVTAEVTYCL